ncbi:hypothetical protein Tsubulata_044686 [Turnera subulata]|uniref:Serine-threonine/tyrosine-protein kinase catalytic domain-containing protein n=1 Tax=Turnera subulata TaxID=218843 RepID=A0A9Q0G8U6_9ROSI|nr:hypothetical protein Tsubulata_044686 [Turnera subulata]
MEESYGGAGHYLCWKFVPPEYAFYGSLTEKADAYSYGVLLFYILTGSTRNRFIQEDDQRFWPSLALDIDHVVSNGILDVVDPALLQEGSEEAKLRDFAVLGVKCVSPQAENRPTMI